MKEFCSNHNHLYNFMQIIDYLNTDPTLQLSNAIHRRDPELVEKYIKSGANINCIYANHTTPLIQAIQRFDYKKIDQSIQVLKLLLDCEEINPFIKDYSGNTPKKLALTNNLPIVNLLHQAEDNYTSNNIAHHLTLSQWQKYLLKTVENNYPVTTEKLLYQFDYLNKNDWNKVFLSALKYSRLKILIILEKYLPTSIWNNLITTNRSGIAELSTDFVINTVVLTDSWVNAFLEGILIPLKFRKIKYKEKIKMYLKYARKNFNYQFDRNGREHSLKMSPLFIVTSYAGIQGLIQLFEIIKGFSDAPADLSELISEAWAEQALFLDKSIKITPLDYCMIDPYSNYYQHLRLREILSYYPINQRNPMGETGLLFAIKNNNIGAALEILDYNMHHIVVYKNVFKNFVLANHKAPVEINVIIASFIGLLPSLNFEGNTRILDVNISDNNNISPLLAAINLKDRKHKRKNPSLKFKLVEKLLLSGSRINIPEYSILDFANKIYNINLNILRLLNKFQQRNELLSRRKNHQSNNFELNNISFMNGSSLQVAGEKKLECLSSHLDFDDFNNKVFMLSYQKYVANAVSCDSNIARIAMPEFAVSSSSSEYKLQL